MQPVHMKKIAELKAGLKGLGFNDYFRRMKEAEEAVTDPSPLRIAVLRSYTSEMIEPVLRLRLLLEGYSPEFLFGDYNKYVQEILDPGSALYAFRPDMVLLLTRLEDLMPEFTEDFASKPASEWESRIRESVRQISSLAETLEKRVPAQIIIQNLTLNRPYWGGYDAQGPEGQTYLVGLFNRLLAGELQERKNAFIWDFDGFVRLKGFESVYEPKMWYTSRNPFRHSAYVQMGEDLTRYILGALGRVKKCVVVDLDNTLWGGIAGEDGMNGVRLGFDYPGNCYREFQKGLLRLYKRGIILAVNSKNNENDAMEIIEKHPYMVLRASHFAAMRINWEDKVSNLRSIADELNIGTESMIFIDDSSVECGLVSELAPEVTTVCLPDKPYLIPLVPETLEGTDNLRLTEEDRKKGELYRSQAERKTFEKSFTDIDEYLASLGVEVTVEPATGFSLARIAQLTQKTNQMNMTTRRYTEANIRDFMDSTDSFVFSVASKDRFGDNGIIGVFILRLRDGDCLIDTFLLSCRVIGRRIEDAMISFIAGFAAAKGAATLTGEFIPTAKNLPAAGMYERLKFKKTGEGVFTVELSTRRIGCPRSVSLKTAAAGPGLK
ncbi:MAG TPA: HAD-IIIC family phosphatase [Thermodesulfobacteriota bacterium]|nr:HAD-IIIC family phosphatase [Thermodesulfobacteriota bacterium]